MNDRRPHPNRFPRSRRVRHQLEFDRVYRENVYAADETLVVLGRDNRTSTTRLGLSVSRRVGNAVIRNRWKRLIREAFRQQQQQLPTGLDLVVRPRRGARISSDAIYHALPRLSWRIERKLKRKAQ